MTRREIVTFSRLLVGTAFHHQGRLPGVGLDCAGVLIVIGRHFGIVAPDFDITGYSRTPSGRDMLTWLERYMVPTPQRQMAAGDAVAMIVDADPQHLGVLANHAHGGLSIIHATRDRGVIETRLMFSRAQRFVAAYAFPGIQ